MTPMLVLVRYSYRTSTRTNVKLFCPDTCLYGYCISQYSD